jgi:hypothetical protein
LMFSKVSNMSVHHDVFDRDLTLSKHSSRVINHQCHADLEWGTNKIYKV